MPLIFSKNFPSPDFVGTPLLSPNETVYKDRLSNSGRGSQWLYGRMLAKYLFLQYQDRGTGHTQDFSPNFAMQDMGRFPAHKYKEVEILPESGTNRKPFLYWRGKKQSAGVSLSYSGSHVAASVSENPLMGIDVEQIEESRPEFYHCSFNSSERAFVMDLCADPEQKTWMFTLLWTIKEAGLKGSRDTRWNLWNLPSMEIDLSGSEQKLAQFYRGKTAEVEARASIKGFGRCDNARLTIHRLNRKILTRLCYE